MGCCFISYKTNFEVYFRSSIKTLYFYDLNIQQISEIILQGKASNDDELNTKLSEINKKYDNTEKNDKISDNTNISNLNFKNKYLAIIELLIEKDSNKQINENINEDFPKKNEFLKILFESLFRGNKDKLILNFIPYSVETERENLDIKSLNKVVYDILIKDNNEMNLSSLKLFINDYLFNVIINPFESVFYKTDDIDRKVEVKEIIENITGSNQIEEFTNSILNQKYNMSYSNKDKDINTNLNFELFNEIFSNANWSWNVFKLRELFFTLNQNK